MRQFLSHYVSVRFNDHQKQKEQQQNINMLGLEPMFGIVFALSIRSEIVGGHDERMIP